MKKVIVSKKIIVSLCTVSLLSIFGLAQAGLNVAANAEATGGAAAQKTSANNHTAPTGTRAGNNLGNDGFVAVLEGYNAQVTKWEDTSWCMNQPETCAGGAKKRLVVSMKDDQLNTTVLSNIPGKEVAVVKTDDLFKDFAAHNNNAQNSKSGTMKIVLLRQDNPSAEYISFDVNSIAYNPASHSIDVTATTSQQNQEQLKSALGKGNLGQVTAYISGSKSLSSINGAQGLKTTSVWGNHKKTGIKCRPGGETGGKICTTRPNGPPLPTLR